MNMNELFSVKNKVVLVTGSSRGIGRALAEGYAAAGARVAVNARHQDKVDEVVDAIKKQDGSAKGFAFDVTDRDDTKVAVQKIEREFGPIDILVNNVGIHRRNALMELTDDDWEKVISVNLTTVFIVSQVVAKRMQELDIAGKIVNISSLNAWASRPNIANYCAAKGGVNSLTHSMATEWGPLGINTNAIAPGYFITELTKPLSEDPQFDAWVKKKVPLGRWGDPEDLVGAAIFLSSSASSYVNGQIFYVDGGWTAAL